MIRNLYCFWLMLALVLFASCDEDVGRGHYDIPEGLDQTVIGVLEDEGKFGQFLKGVDLLEERRNLESSSFTIFAPNDDVLLPYLKSEYGVSDIGELDKEDLESLIKGHIIRNSLTWQKMYRQSVSNRWTDEVTGEDPVNANGYQVIRQEVVYRNPVIEDNNHPEGKIYKVYEPERFLPVFPIHRLCGILEPADYDFLFPDSKYTGFNIHGAKAVEQDIPAVNGTVHFVDKVLPVLKNADEIMAEKDGYTLFKTLTDRFAEYNFDGDATEKYGESPQDSIFRKRHRNFGLAQFASSRMTLWTGSDGKGRNRVYNVFLPTDQALEEYFQGRFGEYYTSYDEVPEDILFFMVKNHFSLYHNKWIRPSELKFFATGLFEEGIVDKGEVQWRTFANNAVIYGMNRVLAPEIYSSAAGVTMFNPDYSWLLKSMVIAPSARGAVANLKLEATFFGFKNGVFEDNDIRYSELLESFVIFDSQKQKDVRFDPDDVEDLLSMHVSDKGNLADASGRTFLEMKGGYVCVNNNKAYGGGNEEDGEEIDILSKDTGGENGTFYELSGFLKAPTKNVASHMLDNDEYSEFAELMKKAKLANDNSSWLISGKEVTVLIPTNEAIEEAKDKGLIPEEEKELINFLRYFFIEGEQIFTDGGKTGEFDTMSAGEDGQNKMIFAFEGDQLTVTDGSGRKVVVDRQRNVTDVLAKGGTIHQINSILSSK
ncbi:fasciclin (plasmid) [Fulvitalea axinellae]|uniref:Fasciclin n=1 Tax=Fulvitalea axinellae TaxID=1182444 RepID=A0AAU9CWN8_9BACT|nr:fasciclin [Fulvitalea axinellae]